MSLTFRQTRYQALYKDVQRLIEDTASIAVRRGLLVYVISLPHTAATGYEGGPCICCLFYRSCYAILIIPITIMNNIYILNIHIIIFIELFFAY